MRDIENLMAYLPTVILKHLMVDKLRYPDDQRYKNAVCLFADVSGFTSLSEKLCKEGPDGIEELASQLNKFMGQIVKLTSRAGGDVLKFAGDAMFAVWLPEEGEKDALQNALLLAINCCTDMQLRLRDYKFVFRSRDTEGRENGAERLTGSLYVKLGIGVGDASIFHIGGESDNVMTERFDYVAIGQALNDAFFAESHAKPGQVVISKNAYQVVSKFVQGEFVEGRKGFVVNSASQVRWKKKADEFALIPTQEIETRVWKCVPAAVLPYLNESNEFWAPELRRVTTLFCNLGYTEEDLTKDRVDLASIADVFKAMQQSVFQFEGTINKFLCDDKGSTLIVVFGLPPFAHENDATRGVLSAMSILAALHDLGKEGAIGITTGEAFCGVVGTRGNRREYSVIGDTINTAARLMVEAKKRGCGHLMDEVTAEAVKDDLSVEFYNQVLLKGKQNEISVFQVSGGKQAPSLQVARITGLPSPRNIIPKRIADSAGSVPGPSTEKKKKKTGKTEKLPPQPIPVEEPSLLAVNMATAQRSQIAAITEAPKLREKRDLAIKSRLEQLSSKDKAEALAKSLDSFAQQSQKGLQMGTGRVRSGQDLQGTVSPPPLHLNKARAVKAAQITFNNCATPVGAKPELSTTFTLILVEGIDTFYDLKDAALTRLASRQLLARGPQAKRELFTLRWKEPTTGREGDITHEKERLDDLKDLPSPIIQLVLIEQAGPPRAGSKLSMAVEAAIAPAFNSASGVFNTEEDRDVVGLQLETVRNNLVWGDGNGKVVVLEGMQGVGKTRLAESIFLKSDVVASTLTAVAMGNPYETERLSSPLSVWAVILKQLLEEAIFFKRIRSGGAVSMHHPSVDASELTESDINEAQEIARGAVKRFDPKFSNFETLDTLVNTLLHTGHLPGIRASMSPEESTNGSARGLQGPLRTTVQVVGSLVVGLSQDIAPTIVMIDDSHYMDVASWHLALFISNAIAEHRAPLVVVLLHRNLILAEMFSAGTGATSDLTDGVDRHNMRAIDNMHTRHRREIAKLYSTLLEKEYVLHVEKKSMPHKTSEIICATLGVESVQAELLTFLTNKSHGNALFIRDALRALQKAELISIKGKTIALPETFHERLKYHELPIPPSVEGICATLLDTMSTTQQIALKVAAMIGETFTLSLVREIFPINHLSNGLDQEWEALVRLGVVTEFGLRGGSEIVFQFGNGWMLETLRKRMLGKQRRKLLELYKLVTARREEQTRANFIQTAMSNNTFTVNKAGWLYVRKDHARNMLQPWKKRWVVLKDDELTQYYDETNPKKLEVIKLAAPETSVANRVGGYLGYEANFGEKHYPFCFTVHAPRWIKKGNLQAEPRDFFMAPESLEAQSDWVFKLVYQIDFYKLQRQSQEVVKLPPTTTHLDVYAKTLPEIFGEPGSHMSSIAGVRKLESKASLAPFPAEPPPQPPSFLAKITGTSRKSVSSNTSAISVRTRTRSFLPTAPAPTSETSGSNKEVALGTEFQNPGASIVPMTSAHFKAISRDEALATFWASDSTTIDDVLVLRSSHHVSWFYEFGDMAFVSLNGQGAIDGYLLGFVSSRTPDHAVVHQVAVIPTVRRYGIGTKLYHKFFELAKKRDCRWVRALVPRDSLGAIAFHRALGFEELGGEDWLANDMIIFIRELRD